jgi:hypothetical protein
MPYHSTFWPIFDELCGNTDYETDDDALAYNSTQLQLAQSCQRITDNQRIQEETHSQNNAGSIGLTIRCTSPTSYALDGPTVSTPGELRALPALRTSISNECLDAPEIASPIDTPVRSTSIHEGRGKRDDPATPLPLGEATFIRLRKVQGHMKMSKLFEDFEKGLAKGSSMKKKGSGIGKILEGCRICLPLNNGVSGANTHNGRWKQVSQRSQGESDRRSVKPAQRSYYSQIPRSRMSYTMDRPDLR